MPHMVGMHTSAVGGFRLRVPAWQNGNTSPALQETDAVGKQKAQERFQRIKTAYEVLKDPQMRKDYDSGSMAATV